MGKLQLVSRTYNMFIQCIHARMDLLINYKIEASKFIKVLYSLDNQSRPGYRTFMQVAS